MKISSYSHMLVSDHRGWDELRVKHPTARGIFFKLVLPLSILPVLMITYAGMAHGSFYAPNAPMQYWLSTALLFFVAELLSVRGMAWVINVLSRQVAGKADKDNSYLLATLAAVPLWLSSLTLFVPVVAFNMLCGLLGLGIACLLLYHGVPAMLSHDRDEDTRDMTWLVMWIGAGAWAVLGVIAALPVIIIH
ncbi:MULTISPECIES: YIP1 family protein [Silvimonas]|uniref:YIP1 family protein n=1 Tax=Silvimonas TaxID=300264 RepID=UPI0024B32352|nr:MULTISPECIES: YIP1 family protein [Silvimonas]MDR3428901.1 YIP1 family protein [Silvimonas sp.]